MPSGDIKIECRVNPPMLTKHVKELRRLFGKFREGTLTTLEALSGYLFFYLDCSLLVIPAFALFFIDTEFYVTDDKRIFYAEIFFFALVFIKWMILFSRTLPKKPPLPIRIYRVLGSTAFAAAFSFICGMGYFIFWNAVSGSGKTMLVSGPIVHTGVGTGNRYTGKPHYITIRHDERDIKLTVPLEEYAKLSLGQTYYREMKLGGLGYYYNWGSSWWK